MDIYTLYYIISLYMIYQLLFKGLRPRRRAAPPPWGLPGGSLGGPGGSQEALGEVWEALGELWGTPGELPESSCGALCGFQWSLRVPRDLHEASKKPPGDSQVCFWDPKGSPK